MTVELPAIRARWDAWRATRPKLTRFCHCQKRPFLALPNPTEPTFAQPQRKRTLSRFLPLREELDLYALYASVESEFLAGDSAVTADESTALVARMRQHASDVQTRLESSGLLSSRPPNSPLPAFFDEMFALQAEMMAAWETPGVEAINAVYADFMISSDFLISFEGYLEQDALTLCR